MKARRTVKKLLPMVLGFILLIGMVLCQQVNADESGEQLYLSNCAVCHRSQGEGIDNIFPSLQGNAYVLGDAEILVATVLNGRGAMPSFRSDLNDIQMSAVVNYIRTKFGNQSSAITPALIVKLRKVGSEKIISDHDVQ